MYSFETHTHIYTHPKTLNILKETKTIRNSIRFTATWILLSPLHMNPVYYRWCLNVLKWNLINFNIWTMLFEWMNGLILNFLQHKFNSSTHLCNIYCLRLSPAFHKWCLNRRYSSFLTQMKMKADFQLEMFIKWLKIEIWLSEIQTKWYKENAFWEQKFTFQFFQSFRENQPLWVFLRVCSMVFYSIVYIFMEAEWTAHVFCNDSLDLDSTRAFNFYDGSTIHVVW